MKTFATLRDEMARAYLAEHWAKTIKLEPELEEILYTVYVSVAQNRDAFWRAEVKALVEALEYTQRTDVIIGHDESSDDGKLRGMPDKIMMRNICAKALAAFKERTKE